MGSIYGAYHTVERTVEQCFGQHLAVFIFPSHQVGTSQTLACQLYAALATHEFTQFGLGGVAAPVYSNVSTTRTQFVNDIKYFIGVLTFLYIDFGNGKQYFGIAKEDGTKFVIGKRSRVLRDGHGICTPHFTVYLAQIMPVCVALLPASI